MFLHYYVIVLILTNFTIMHVVLKHSYDARKALQKNGIQLSSGLIVGVKPIDAVHRQQLDESFARSSQGGFMVSLPSKSVGLKSTGASHQLGALPRPYDPKANTNVSRDAGRRVTGSVAAPAKSIVTNVMDLIFGIWYAMRTNASGTFSVSSVYLFENASIPKIQQQILLKFESLQSELSFGDVTLKLCNFSRLLYLYGISIWGQLYVNGNAIALVVGDFLYFLLVRVFFLSPVV